MTMQRIIGRHIIGILVLLMVTFISDFANLNSDVLQSSNAVVLIAFILLSLWTAYELIKTDPQMVWMPLTLYTVSSALFYGFGPLAYTFGNEGTRTYLAFRKISASPQNLVDATMLSLTGIGLVFVGALAFLTYRPEGFFRTERFKAPVFSPELVAWALLIAGLIFKYAIIYPSKWGLIDLVIPGFLTQLDTMAALGFGLLAFVAFGRNRRLIPVFFVLWTIDFCLTTLAFSKSPLVFAMIFPIAGYFLAVQNKFVTGMLTLMAIGVYTLSQPMVVYARMSQVEISSEPGYVGHAKVILHYLAERPEVISNSNYYGSQAWWTRFEFSGKQAYAMDLHDRGITSSSLSQLPIIFIPRVIWHDKPLIRGPGQDFYYLVTGRDSNNMSMSVYADMYWQFGWLGLILISPLLGVAFAAMTVTLLPEISKRNFIYFPAVLIGFQYALLDPNKYLINGAITTVVFFILYLLLVRFVASRFSSDKSDRIAHSRIAGLS